jgi:riboflavin kinase/FMN adenylyltransferase
MRIIRHCSGPPAAARGAVIAIGNFDGVHRGHQVVIAEAGRLAAALDAPHGVLTFEPHPRTILQAGALPFRLMPFRAKARAIADFGVEFLFIARFDAAMAATEAPTFVTEVLVAGLAARHIVVGRDFVFGHGRAGDRHLLDRMAVAEGFGLTVLDPVGDDDAVFASGRVRESLAAGRPDEATALLGRPWEVEGRVRRGAGRGAALGVPTANLDLKNGFRPRLGIYAARIAVETDTVWRDGVAYVGARPTFGGDEVALEAHLFDFAGDITGRRVRVALVGFIRDDATFADADTLSAQMAADCTAARAALAKTTGMPPEDAQAPSPSANRSGHS